jgi:hypothetical protein
MAEIVAPLCIDAIAAEFLRPYYARIVEIAFGD